MKLLFKYLKKCYEEISTNNMFCTWRTKQRQRCIRRYLLLATDMSSMNKVAYNLHDTVIYVESKVTSKNYCEVSHRGKWDKWKVEVLSASYFRLTRRGEGVVSWPAPSLTGILCFCNPRAWGASKRRDAFFNSSDQDNFISESIVLTPTKINMQ